MGGVGSGRKARDKSRATKTDFKPAKKTEEEKPKEMIFSVPAHVRAIRTPGGVRFEG